MKADIVTLSANKQILENSLDTQKTTIRNLVARNRKQAETLIALSKQNSDLLKSNRTLEDRLLLTEKDKQAAIEDTQAATEKVNTDYNALFDDISSMVSPTTNPE